MTQKRFNDNLEFLLQAHVPSSIAVAVSGGADSVSLLHFLSVWTKENNIRLYILSVDHGLRHESPQELEYVKNLTKSLGHEFYPLYWKNDGGKASLQRRARDGRYELMTKKCHEIGTDTLLTAHHLDDMIETYLMREKKKSGVFGLSMAKTFFHNNIRILRPLFNINKIDLINYLKNNKIEWKEDNSNISDLYERNRVRKELERMSEQEKLSLQQKLQESDEKSRELNEELIFAIAESVHINNYGFAVLDIKKWQRASCDVRIQILSYLMTIISGKTQIPRFRNLEQLLNKLFKNIPINSSLHGCILKTKNDKLQIFREKSAINNSVLDTKNGKYWDNRFVIKFEKEPENISISSMNLDDYISIKNKIDTSVLEKISDYSHKLFLLTLPVVKKFEKIIAIPHICYYDNFGSDLGVDITFRPNFISRFTHFL